MCVSDFICLTFHYLTLRSLTTDLPYGISSTENLSNLQKSARGACLEELGYYNLPPNMVALGQKMSEIRRKTCPEGSAARRVMLITAFLSLIYRTRHWQIRTYSPRSRIGYCLTVAWSADVLPSRGRDAGLLSTLARWSFSPRLACKDGISEARVIDASSGIWFTPILAAFGWSKYTRTSDTGHLVHHASAVHFNDVQWDEITAFSLIRDHGHNITDFVLCHHGPMSTIAKVSVIDREC